VLSLTAPAASHTKFGLSKRSAKNISFEIALVACKFQHSRNS
jgi:hypothetical protein